MVTAQQLINEQTTTEDLIRESSKSNVSIDKRSPAISERLQKTGRFISKSISNVGKTISAREARMRTNVQQKFTPAPLLSREQQALKELFGGGSMSWGTGNNLPRMNGGINPDTVRGQPGGTASCFGHGKRTGTGRLFGF